MVRKIVSPASDDAAPPPRVSSLRVARISDVGAWQDLEDKIKRLWSVPPVPSCRDWLLQLGTEPLQQPQVVGAEVYRQGPTRAVLFPLPDDDEWGLYALGSAASTDADLDGDNAFVHLVANVMAQLRPRTVVVPEFDRLIRDVRHVSQLWREFKSHVDELRSFDERIGIHEPHAEMRFMLAALAASTEAAAIRRRTFWGKLQTLMDGGTILSEYTMPPGYRRGDDGRVEPDPGQRAWIEVILHAMAYGLSDREVIANAAAAGVTTPLLRKLHGPHATVADHVNPNELVRGWYANLELWHTGQRTQALRALDEGRGDYEGFPVERDADGHDYVLVTQKWGLPEEGWAPENIFEAAYVARQQRATRARPTGGAAHKQRRPLADLVKFEDDTPEGRWQYKLCTHQTGFYELRRRLLCPGDDPNAGWGRRPHLQGERSATVACALLHERLADGIVAAIRDGVPVEWLDGHHAWREGDVLRVAERAPDPTKDLERRIARTEKQLTNLTDSIANARTEALRDRLTQDADRVQRELDELHNDLAAANAERQPVEEPDTFDSELGFLVSCLAVLRETHESADAELGDALSTILEQLELRPDPNGDELTWNTRVRVPARGGVACVHAQGRVPAATLRKARSIAAQQHDILEAFMTEDVTIDEVTTRFGKTSTDRVQRALLAELATHGLPRGIRGHLVHRAPLPARQVVWASLNRRRWPQDTDPGYADHVAHAYIQSPTRGGNPGRRHQAAARAQLICDYLADRGGTAPRAQVVTDLADRGVTDAAVATALEARVAPGHRYRPRAIRRCPERPSTDIALLDCPHCGGWARIVCHLPEVPDGLLCPDCRRAPVADSPPFPSAYFPTNTTPRGDARKAA